MPLEKIQVKGANGAPLHPMQASTCHVPDIHWNWLKDGRVTLSIFCRCGATTGRWFYWEGDLPDALHHMAELHEAEGKSKLRYMENLFRWEWTGGTPTLDGTQPKTTEISLSDLGL